MSDLECSGVAVSVVVPVHNASAFLETCVNSILGQSLHLIEVVLVDDGSTDGSELLCDAYARADSRVMVVHQENGGVQAAVNVGIVRSRGEYIAFVDADDWIDCGMIERLYFAALEFEADIVQCGWTRIGDGGVEAYTGTPSSIPQVYDRTQFLTELLGFWRMDFPITVPSRWNKAFRGRLLRQLVAEFDPDVRIGEDLHLVLTSALRADTIVGIPEFGYYYREVASSATNSYSPWFSRSNSALVEALNRIAVVHSDLAEPISLYVAYMRVLELLNELRLPIGKKRNLRLTRIQETIWREGFPSVGRVPPMTGRAGLLWFGLSQRKGWGMRLAYVVCDAWRVARGARRRLGVR